MTPKDTITPYVVCDLTHAEDRWEGRCARCWHHAMEREWESKSEWRDIAGAAITEKHEWKKRYQDLELKVFNALVEVDATMTFVDAENALSYLNEYARKGRAAEDMEGEDRGWDDE